MSGKRIMQTIVRVALVAAVAASIAAPAQGAEAGKGGGRRDATSCGGKWDAAATCGFRYTGGAVKLDADFRATGFGFVTIRLETVDPATGQRVPVVSCGAASTDFGGCSSIATEEPAPLEWGQKLFCSVQGLERGTYRCANRRA